MAKAGHIEMLFLPSVAGVEKRVFTQSWNYDAGDVVLQFAVPDLGRKKGGITAAAIKAGPWASDFADAFGPEPHEPRRAYPDTISRSAR